MLTLTDLHKAYGDRTALDGISFEVHRGEAFALLGPNGAGKSTTMRLLAALELPDRGEILYEGTPRGDLQSFRRNIGYVPQELSLYEELTARENLLFFGSLYQLPGRELKERVAYFLRLVELEARADEPLCGYSGGMKRRINLAAALLHHPSLLLLDEPTVGIDPQSKLHIMELLAQLKKEGTTLIYTSHQIEEVERLCDRVAIIDHGKIIAIDYVKALLERHSGPNRFRLIHDDFGEEETMIDCSLEELSRQLLALQEKNIPLREITLLRSDLETVFLKLTGRGLRDP